MAGPRKLVQPPSFVPSQYGLLSVAQTPVDNGDPHWQNGVTWQSVCGLAVATYSTCATGGALGPHTKSRTHTQPTRGAYPFGTFAELDCSPFGFWDDAEERVAAALTETEARQVEYTFWTGAVANGFVVYPHLAANAQVLDADGVVIQTAVTPAATGTTYDIVEGVGRLEQALADCLGGVGVLHVPAALGTALDEAGLVRAAGGQLRTLKGNLVALGDGYPGTSPAGVASDLTKWIYATGQVFAYRGRAATFTKRESFDHGVNTVKMIAERAYLLGWECCHLGIPITMGGVVAGSPNAAN